MRTRNKTETLDLGYLAARWSSMPPQYSTLPPDPGRAEGARAVSQVPTSEVQRTAPAADERSEGLVQTLLDSSLEGVFVLDERLTVCAVNKALAELAEATSEELLEHHVLDVFPLMQQLGPDVFEFVLQGRTLGGCLECIKPEQSQGLSFEVRLTPIFEAGAVSGILGIVRDVSQRRQNVTRLEHIQKLGLAARLATSSAHDLSNLLTVIQAEVARALILCEDPELSESLMEIQHCTEKSGVLTRDILNFARKNSEHAAPVRAAQLVGDCRRMFERLLGPDVTLKCDLLDDISRVSVLRGELEQVLVNLVANARDAVSPGGCVEVSVRRVIVSASVAPPSPEVAPGEYSCIEVKDNGQGMSPAAQRHLFEAFFTTKPEGQGTGLGLSTSRDIIERSGGQLLVQSEARVGTRVSIWLPVYVDDCSPTVRPMGPGLRKASLVAPPPAAQSDQPSGHHRISAAQGSDGNVGQHPSDRPRTGSHG